MGVVIRIICGAMALVLAGTPSLAAVCDATCAAAHVVAAPTTPAAAAENHPASAPQAVHHHHHAGHHAVAGSPAPDAAAASARVTHAPLAAAVGEPSESDCPTDSQASSWFTATRVDPNALVAVGIADAPASAIVPAVARPLPWHRLEPRPAPSGARAPRPLRI